MNQTLLSLVIGLAAGVCGAVLPGLVFRDDAASGTGGSTTTSDLRAIVERLDAIEARLAQRGPAAPVLRGAAEVAPEAPRLAADDQALIDAVVARYDEHMRSVVSETVAEEIGKHGSLSQPMPIEVPPKKKVTLAELAVELELSSYEEAELKRISDETSEKVLALLATEEDGGVETVRRDLDEAKADPEKRKGLVTKYMGRMFSHLGDFIVLGQEHEAKVAKLIGKEKADRLQSEFEVSDLDRYSLESVLSASFEAE